MARILDVSWVHVPGTDGMRRETAMFTTEDLDGVTVVTASHELDARNSQKVKDEFKELINAGRSKIVVDLSSLGFIDSSGLGALVTALKTARQAGGDVRLCGLTTPVRSIFELTRLFRVFDIFDSRADALRDFP